MAQVYVISNAFPAKDKAGNEKTWESQYGTFKVWNMYFQDDDTKYQTNKKIDFQGFAPGDTVYGEIGEDKYGNATFKSEQKPFNGSAPQQSAPKAAAPQVSGDIEKKLDYIISLLENSSNFKSSEPTTTAPDAQSAEADGVDALPY